MVDLGRDRSPRSDNFNCVLYISARLENLYDPNETNPTPRETNTMSYIMTESHWHGKPLSTMTRDELIKALEQLVELYDSQANSHEHDLNILVPRRG